MLLCTTVLEAHLDLKESSLTTGPAVCEPQSELSASATGGSSPSFTGYCREQYHISLESALLAAGALQALRGAQKLFYICCTLSSNGPARFHSSIRLPHCNHSPAYHHVFYVIGAHPSTQGHGSERRLQTIHVEQEWAIITLNERCHSAAPAKRGTNLASLTEHKTNAQTNVANHFSFSFPSNIPTVCYLHLKFGFRFVTLSIRTFCKTHLRQKDLPTHTRFSWCGIGPLAGRGAVVGKP